MKKNSSRYQIRIGDQMVQAFGDYDTALREFVKLTRNTEVNQPIFLEDHRTGKTLNEKW